MHGREHRRVLNQTTAQVPEPRTQSDYEQLRRALLMVVAQFKAGDPEGCYTVDVRVVLRDRVKTAT